MIGMFRKKPTLKYESAINFTDNSILPARNFIPEWYKKIPKFKDDVIFNENKLFGHTVKLCVPFLDSLTVGYMISLPYDIYVKNNNGAPFITWPVGISNQEAPALRPEIAHEKIIPIGCSPCEFTWNYCISYTLPKGYSALITHPLNRHDLPFITLSGIIDGGLVMSAHGNLPFYIKNGFEGIINKGTPIAQIIPFRQENWKSTNASGLVKEGQKHNRASTSLILGWYKKTFWIRKKYD